MSTKKTFESFVNSMNENVDLYKVYKKVSGKYSLRKPSYWGDLFNQRASIPYRELTKFDKELHSLDVYTTKELGCHNEYPLQSNFKVQVPQVFVLYCNTESGELGEYYGMSILVNTEGATYPRYACGMPDFEPELHNFVNGIPESYLNIVTTGAQLLHEKMIVEGQFSWLTNDTNTQIGSERENMITVFMYDNKGNKWTEKDYEGYGEFGGMDYYDLVATMNGYTEEDVKGMKGKVASIEALRQLGIDLAFGKIKTKDKKKKTLFPALVEDPRFNWKRHDFTQEAESDPNQSWYQEEESDDDYDDDYENGWYESVVTEAKKLKVKDVEKAWDFSYGEDFKDEYGGVYDEIIGKYKGKITKDELAKLWDEMYGEDLQDEHGGFFDKLDENLNEATVVMDAIDPKSKTLKKLLKKYNVKMKVLTMNGPGGNHPEVEMTGSREDLQSILADPNGWDDPELGEYIEESNISEARSINKISKEFGETVNKMKDIVKIYIAAEDGSDEKAKTRQQLIDLTAKKKALTNELDDAVAGKNKDVKLVITEGVMSDIHQMIGNHKTFDTFQKEFFKEYGHKKVMKKTPEFLGWLKALYNDFEYTSGEAVEEKYTKKSLLKKLGDADDAMIQTGNGKEYIIYNPDSNNDDNAAMWHAKSVFALDQDGEEHEIDYKDIGLVMVESVVTVNEKDDAGTHLDNLADLVGKAKDFFAIGKELKSGKYKYDYSDSMMPMYTIKADGFKFAILNKRYVDGGDREVGEIAIGLMESKIQIKRRYTDNHPAQTSGRTARVRNAMIEALADGVLTEEEFNNILKEKSIDNKRWMRRNSKYFTVSENGIGLSKFGKRILTGIKPVVSLTLESFISEKANISGAYNDLEHLLGTDMETMDDFQRIENDGTWEEMSDFIEMAGDVEVLRRHKFKSQKDIDKLAKYIMGESVVNEANYIKFKGKKVDISSLEMEDVDMKDYPDFSDAYFSYGEYSNGKEMTDEELSDFTDDNLDLANELAHDSLH